MKKYGFRIRLIYGLIFVVCAFTAFCLAFPFQPYKHLEFQDMTDKACVNGPVEVIAQREIKKPLLGEVREAKVKSWWEDVETGQREYAGEVDIEIAPTSNETIASPVLREASTRPGEYYLYSETTAYGKLGPFNRHGTIAVYGNETLTVEYCGGPR